MEIEHQIRYTTRAMGLKPSAIQGKARLRGRERIMYSKTIISFAAWGLDSGSVQPRRSGSTSC